VIETSAASAMLHAFYTEIGKFLKLVAREWGRAGAIVRFMAQGPAASDVASDG